MNDEATPGRSGSATVRPFLLAPRDWQAIALREAADVAGTPECSAKMVESKRYAALADEIERLRARVLDLEAVHEDASGAILQAVAAERERCAKLCEDISDEFQRTEGRRHPELKSDAQEGAATCADRIRLGAQRRIDRAPVVSSRSAPPLRAPVEFGVRPLFPKRDSASVQGLNDVDKQTNLISRLQDEADLCRNEGAADIAALLDEATEALRVERVVLAELVLKAGELIEHLQKTGRLKPCFYLPALADARNVLEAKNG